ncbi:MAG: SBBP repeat-containing protein [Caldilineaceae bacterium]|nr:SBBP repeat-containing protein [Caldilineaceae bacterium]
MILRSLGVCALLCLFFLAAISTSRAAIDEGSVALTQADLEQVTVSAAVTATQVFTKSLHYSTYVDGRGTVLQAIAVDVDGSSVAVGYTTQHSLTLVSPYQSTWSCDVNWPPPQTGVIVKLNPTGTETLFATYFGADCFTDITGVALDGAGNIYVAGSTRSDNFPLVNALPSSASGTRGFVAKFSADGSQLLFSTLLGGSGRDEITGIALGADGSIFVAGMTNSPDLPVQKALASQLSGMNDGFIARLKADLSGWNFVTYLGGSKNDRVEGLAVARDNSVYVTGVTHSDDFPTQNSLGDFGADNTAFTGFVARIAEAPNQLNLLYSTFLGGSRDTHAFAIAVDRDFNAYVTGLTASPDFPVTASAYMTTIPGFGYQGFVASLGVTGTLRYGTYYGGPGGATYGYAIAADNNGHVYVAGQTRSQGLPSLYAGQQGYGGGQTDGFVLRMDTTGGELAFASYLGSGQGDEIKGLAIDGHGGVYVAGSSAGEDWPTTPGVVAETPTACCGNGVISRLTTLPWALLFYKAFDSDLSVHASTRMRLMEFAANNPNVKIVALHDINPAVESSRFYSDSAYYAIQHYPHSGFLPSYQRDVNVFFNQELDTSKGETLADFVKWARARYPARHYALMLDSHGSGITGANNDYHNQPLTSTQSTQMSVPELALALADATDNGKQKLDIIYGILCLMGMIEPAYEWRHAADYYVASQQIYFAFPSVLSADIRSVTRQMTPEAYARALVDNYASAASAIEIPYTISIADLSKAEDLHRAVWEFGNALGHYLRTMPTADRQKLIGILEDIQYFDSTGDFEIDPLSDEYVDLYDFALQVHLRMEDPVLSIPAQALMGAIGEYIVVQKSGSGWVDRSGSAERYYWEHSNAYGVSIFRYHTPRSFYNRDNFSFLIPPAGPGARHVSQEEGGWKGFMDTYVSIVNPDAADNPTPPPLLAWIDPTEEVQAPVFDLFLPQVQR